MHTVRTASLCHVDVLSAVFFLVQKANESGSPSFFVGTADASAKEKLFFLGENRRAGRAGAYRLQSLA